MINFDLQIAKHCIKGIKDHVCFEKINYMQKSGREYVMLKCTEKFSNAIVNMKLNRKKNKIKKYGEAIEMEKGFNFSLEISTFFEITNVVAFHENHE